MCACPCYVGKVSTFWRPHYFERHTFVTWTTTEIHLAWGLKKHANGPIHSHNFTCCPQFREGFCTKKKSILAMFFQRWFSERFFFWIITTPKETWWKLEIRWCFCRRLGGGFNCFCLFCKKFTPTPGEYHPIWQARIQISNGLVQLNHQPVNDFGRQMSR